VTAAEALNLVRELLVNALAAQPTGPNTYVRDLAGRIGELQQTMRIAVTVIDHASAEGASS
jgi:hypothetical protein